MAEDDAALIVACEAARAAMAAFSAEAEKGEPGDLSALYERERLALECVSASRARTPAGIAAKALLLCDCAETTGAVALAVSLAEDATALATAMVSLGYVPE
jgi:hypothetical protein